MANRTKRTDRAREAFLSTLRTGASIGAACRKAGMGRSPAYEWRDEDEDFRLAWDEAVDEGTDVLEDEATRRARDGTVKPVFYQGQECGGIREYSDTLIMFMLKARRPEKYRERHQIEHEIDGQLTVKIVKYGDRTSE